MSMLASSNRCLGTVRSRQAHCVKPLSVRVTKAAQVLPRGAHLVGRAAATDGFDEALAKIADKFEKSENKPVIVGYAAAAAGAFVFAEWFIHLPVLNFLLGGPVQLLGLLMLPYLGVRYLVDNESIVRDVGDASTKVTKLLPGLDK